jgi:hypothetical protein
VPSLDAAARPPALTTIEGAWIKINATHRAWRRDQQTRTRPGDRGNDLAGSVHRHPSTGPASVSATSRVSHRARLTSCRTQVLPSGSLKSANEL